jgi:PAS domain S-box-containing protein
MQSNGAGADDTLARLRDENEQLRTALESAVEENAGLIEDRDRLLGRVVALGRQLQGVQLAQARTAREAPPLPPVNRATEATAEEELRVAFEEMQMLTEELEISNGSLQKLNSDLEARVAERTRAIGDANHILRRTEARWATLVNGIPQLVWRAVGHGDWTWSSTQWTDYTGLSEEQSRGFGWLGAFHPDDREGARQAWARADADHDFTFEGRIRHGRECRYRHFQTRASPVRSPEGAVLEWLGTSTDIDDLLQLRQQQAILIDELHHRTRNLMGVVQAVTQRTLKSSHSLDDFGRCFRDRIAALARVQGLLSRRGVTRITFDALLRAELAAHVDLDSDAASAQVSLEGPDGAPLETALVQTFALALHELATNAVKYGALAKPGGHLAVRWRIVEDDRLHVEWRESGVVASSSPKDAPKGSGYGLELIERALPYQMGATTSFTFTSDGIVCTIEVDIPRDSSPKERDHG